MKKVCISQAIKCHIRTLSLMQLILFLLFNAQYLKQFEVIFILFSLLIHGHILISISPLEDIWEGCIDLGKPIKIYVLGRNAE